MYNVYYKKYGLHPLSINGDLIPLRMEFENIGIHIDQQLIWKQHI